SAYHRIDVAEALAAVQRADAQVDFAELAAAAALLLVAVVPLGRDGDRLLVGDARRVLLGLDAVTPREAPELHFEVQRTAAGDDELPGVLVAAHDERRVLRRELLETLVDLLLVAPGRRVDRQRVGRERVGDGVELERRLVRGQGVPEPQALDLRD